MLEPRGPGIRLQRKAAASAPPKNYRKLFHIFEVCRVFRIYLMVIRFSDTLTNFKMFAPILWTIREKEATFAPYGN